MTCEGMKTTLVNLIEQLENVPEQMRTFSLSMRSLFAENAVCSTSDTTQKFREILDETKHDAIVYIKVVLPLVKQLISGIKVFFAYYKDLSFGDWWECLKDIVKETAEQREISEVLMAIHNDIIFELNKRHSDAIYLMNDINGSRLEIEEKGNETRCDVYQIAIFSVVIRILSGVWCALLSALGFYKTTYQADVIALQRASSINANAVAVARDRLVPALSEFIDGLKAIAESFSGIHNELKSFLHLREEAKEITKSSQSHYYTIRHEAAQAIASCNKFFAVLPEVSSDLEAIHKERTDPNFMEKLMKKQIEIFRTKCSNENLIRKLIQVINHG